MLRCVTVIGVFGAVTAAAIAATGSWGSAIEVPGSAALNVRLNARLTAISCSKAGFCSAGGYHTDGSRHSQAFVVNEKNGVWRKAIEVPGTAARNVGGNARVTSISCARVGFCAAGGYFNGPPHGGGGARYQRAFVARARAARTCGVGGFYTVTPKVGPTGLQAFVTAP